MAAILVIGGALDDKRVIGPFATEADAVDYADHSLGGETWEVAELEAPPNPSDVLGYYTAAIGNDVTLDVRFYATSQACDDALDALEKRERAGEIKGYTGGAVR